MHGLFFAFLAVLAAPAEPPGRDTAPTGSKCVEGVPQPSSTNVLRPTQTAHCPYDVHGAYARLFDLLKVREGRVDIEYMERLFGLPELHTSYDDPRMVDYSVQLTGGAGDSAWRGLLSFREGFWPMVETRPLRFRGSMRPKHIRKGERGDIHLSITLFPLAPPRPWKGCVTLSDFQGRAAAAGWKHSNEPMMFSHGGPGPEAFERGGLRLTPESGFAGNCLTQVALDLEPNPPIPSITEEETELIRRNNAKDVAADVEARWLALPAVEQEDREARNAHAKFMRERMLKMREGSPPGHGDAAIGSMSIDQLREFARRAIAPDDWLSQRELCDQAVKEADPPAALARLAAEHKLDAATAGLLYSRCSTYVEGRRFRHRTLSPP